MFYTLLPATPATSDRQETDTTYVVLVHLKVVSYVLCMTGIAFHLPYCFERVRGVGVCVVAAVEVVDGGGSDGCVPYEMVVVT